MESNNTAVATRSSVGMITPEQTQDWAAIFRKSGLFDVGERVAPDVQEAQAMVKMLAGAEMGLQPFFAMQNLYVVKGHIFVSAAAFGALVNGPDPDGFQRTKFITKESTADKAAIDFYRIDPTTRQWELVHTQTYTWDEVPANRKSQATYQSDRADMIWNRCMTKGAKKACPEKVGGMRTVEEAQDTDWQATSDSLIPEESNVAARTTPEIAAEEPTPVAATSDEVGGTNDEIAATNQAEPAGKPKRKAKATQAESMPPPEAMAAGAENPPMGEGEPDDISDQPVTQDQKNEMSAWVVSEKFPLQDAVKRHSDWQVRQFSELTQGMYHELKQERDAYVRECADAFGWDLPPDLGLTPQQQQYLQKHAGQAARKA